MAVFSCNGCGTDDIINPGDYCPDCAYDKGLIDDAEYDRQMAILTADNDEMTVSFVRPMPEYNVGDKAIWHGSRNLFAMEVTIVETIWSYLVIFGQSYEDGKWCYNIRKSDGTVILAIPANQLTKV